MKIWIDADACPRVIKDIVYRASARLGIPVCLVANNDLSRAHSPLVSSVRVSASDNAADDYIVEHAAPTDLVITADIPLAARIVARDGVAIDPRGDVYTEENVGERLSTRNLLNELREAGIVQGGPEPLGMTDRQKFASALDRLLTRRLKERR
ncbi:YaiI/YqxD family protein [Geoalkalibacter sp.]|uniref:YaiI/YqxD family protein n=1 Tax=Geoalkalibacter sp. TaxID=3041440 RepID=UPI00272E048E|nr:YaiI/YqxD family protein [Geoalkalibacter sp.]